MLSKSCKLSWLFSSLALCLFTSACAPKADDGLSDVERSAVGFVLNNLLGQVQDTIQQIEGKNDIYKHLESWKKAQGTACLSQKVYADVVKSQTESLILLFESMANVRLQQKDFGKGDGQESAAVLLDAYWEMQETISNAIILSQTLAKGCGYNERLVFMIKYREAEKNMCGKWLNNANKDQRMLLLMQDFGFCSWSHMPALSM